VSTTDPRLEREQAIAKRKASPVTRVAIIVLALVHAALWALAGWGIASVMDVFRLMSVNEVGAWTGNHEDDYWMLFVGVFAGAVLGFVLTGRASILMSRGAAVFLPMATAFAGLTVAFAAYFPEWTPAQQVGRRLPFSEGDSGETWGPGDWIAYAVPYWVPAILGLVAIGAILVVIRAARAGRKRTTRILRVMDQGMRVVGRVSDAGSGSVYVNSAPLVTLTVAYTDLDGVARWVTKRRDFPPTAVPKIGDIYTVWYDRDDPANQSSIVLAPGDVTTSTAEGLLDDPATLPQTG
jgi:hypothetical protein